MPAEIPGVIWSPAHPSRVRQRPQAQVNAAGQPIHTYDLVLIHITDGRGNFQNTLDDVAQPGLTSFHFLVGQLGEAAQCVSLRLAAEHAHALNAHSIGIEHECRSDNEIHGLGVLAPTPEMYQKSAYITAYLLKANGLPPTRDYVKGHKEADTQTDHDDCPLGCGWDWSVYMPLVQAAYDSIGTVAPVV